MAVAISIVSEEQNIYVVAFDGKPSISDIVEGVKDKIVSEGIMFIRDWEIGFNFDMNHYYDLNELRKAIDSID
jgi:hypothetical protein